MKKATIWMVLAALAALVIPWRKGPEQPKPVEFDEPNPEPVPNHRPTLRRLAWGSRRRKITTVLLALGLAAGTAWAVWSVTVQPPAKGELATLTITASTPTTAPGADCVPGGTCDGNVRLTNENGAPLKIASFTAMGSTSGQSATLSGTPVGPCTATDIQNNVTIPAQSGLSIPVPVGTTEITIPNLFAIGSNLPSGCQGGIFTLSGGSGFVVTVTTT